MKQKIKYILLLLLFVGSLYSQQEYYEFYVYGDNASYQISDGTTVKKNVPTRIGTDEDWKDIDLGFAYILAIRTDGTLWSWGGNVVGQAGIGTNSTVEVPTQVGSDKNWEKISAGGGHSLAIKKDGTLWAWGNNINGRLGDGTTTNKNIPIQIGSDTDWNFVSAGIRTSFGIKKDGTLWAWGDNEDSRLGDGTTTDRHIPTKIGSDTDWSYVSAGFKHTLALKSDGTLWGWGLNDAYQLGSGTITPISSPIQIGSDNDWEKVVTYKYHNMGIKTNGTLWGWGDNTFKQLGNGLTATLEVPTQIGIETIWSDIALGEYHTVATKSDGTLWGWGWNTPGQLGVGTFSSVDLPTQSGSETTWSRVFAGEWFSAALKIAPTYTLSGRITDTGVGIADINVSNGITTVKTNSVGHFSFSNLVSDDYNITPSNQNYTFQPNEILVNLSSNTSGIDFIATLETDIPNGGDGNNDGTPDYLQPNIFSIKDFFDNSYITLAPENGTEMNQVEAVLPSDPPFSYPQGLVQFQIQASEATVKLYYHGISNWDGYVYRKLNSNNTFFTFEKAVFSLETIGGRTVGVVTLPLTDGGPEDYDGIVNGVIFDPGGPAIPISANIPVWDNIARISAILLILLFGYRRISRRV